MPIKIESHPSATGIFTITNPNSSTPRGITLPDASTTLVGTDATQTLTNKTIQNSVIQGGGISSNAGGNISGTFTDFSDIPSWAKRITIFMSNVSTNGVSNKLLQLGTGGSVVTTGYVSGCMNSRNAGTGAGSTSTTGFTIDNDSIAAYIYNGTIKLHNPSGNTWFIDGLLGDTTGIRCNASYGNISLAGPLSTIRFTTLAGTDTYDSGSFTVQYEG